MKIFEQSPDAILAINKEGKVLFANSKLEELTGFTKKELFDKNFDELKIIAKKDLEKVKNNFKKIIKTGLHEPYVFEIKNKKTKEKIKIEINSNPMRNNENEIIGTYAILRTRNRKKISRSNVMKKREIDNMNMMEALDRISLGVALCELKEDRLRYNYTNEEYCNFLGYDMNYVLEQDVGFTYREFEKTKEEKETIEILMKAVIKGISSTVKIKTYKKNGEEIFLATHVYPITSDKKTFLVFIENVTKTKQLENKMKKELELARVLQSSAMNKPIKDERIEIIGDYHPSEELSGDLYGWVEIERGKYGIILLDMMGHGITSSLISLSVSSMLRHFVTEYQEPKKVAEKLNKHMLNTSVEISDGLTYYFSFVYLFVNTISNEVKYINAGHPPIMHLKSDGEVERLNSNSVSIGMFKDVAFETKRFDYNEGDKLFLYTDGLFEKKNESVKDSLDKLEKIVMRNMGCKNEDFLKKIYNEESNGTKLKDDVSTVIIELK